MSYRDTKQYKEFRKKYRSVSTQIRIPCEQELIDRLKKKARDRGCIFWDFVLNILRKEVGMKKVFPPEKIDTKIKKPALKIKIS